MRFFLIFFFFVQSSAGMLNTRFDTNNLGFLGTVPLDVIGEIIEKIIVNDRASLLAEETETPKKNLCILVEIPAEITEKIKAQDPRLVVKRPLKGLLSVLRTSKSFYQNKTFTKNVIKKITRTFDTHEIYACIALKTPMGKSLLRERLIDPREMKKAHDLFVDLLAEKEIHLRALIDAGVKLETQVWRCWNSEFLLHCAIERKIPAERIKFLLDQGVNINEINDKGHNALMTLVKRYHVITGNVQIKPTISLLIERGINPHYKNQAGQTLKEYFFSQPNLFWPLMFLPASHLK